MTDLRRIVISSQRSGLNWLRFCVEHYIGVRTPGHTLLISKDNSPEKVFHRSHDPASAMPGWTDKRIWRVPPGDTQDYTMVLLVRDPVEAFVRMANQRYGKFANYAANLRYFTEAVAHRKAVFYYEDLISDPAAMLGAMQFLDIAQASGRELPTVQQMAAEWDELGRASRSLYDENQSAGKGSMTKANPLDFHFHKRRLWPWQRSGVWRYLDRTLSSDDLRLVERYRPKRRSLW
ncbi:MAG: hypothetical protein ACO1OG_10175 [Devosia sp.]